MQRFEADTTDNSKTSINAKLNFHIGAYNPIAPNHEVTALELAVYLHRRGCQVYYTGHSLGGGLGTLMAADVFARTGLSSAAGVISFGSPPVGDGTFANGSMNTL